MENKAMYLSTYEERENGSMYEEAYDGRNLSKLNLCDEGKEEGWNLESLTVGVQEADRKACCFLFLEVFIQNTDLCFFKRSRLV